MRRILLSLLVFALTLPALAQAKHPFTFEDMMKLKRVGEPEVSPDGKWVIFSVVDVDLDANTKTPHVWIVPLGASEDKSGVPHVSPNLRDVGGTERVLIPDQDADRPRWAPDGKRFAFLSTKEGGSQVWIADFDGRAGSVTGVHRLTDVATEASGELWSPDGKNILFVSDVYPECDGAPAEEAACNAKKLDEAIKSKVKALIFEHLLYRHWNAYKEGKRSHIFVVPVDACVETAAPAVRPGDAGQPSSAGKDETRRPLLNQKVDGICLHTIPPRDLTPGDYDAPVFSLGGQDDYAYSPDGQEICYTSNHDKNPAASTNNDLWIVPVNAGTEHVGTAASTVQSGEAGKNPVELRSTRQPGAAVATQESAKDYVAEILAHAKNITADNPASDSSPLYSPDGRYIAYRAQQRPGYESDRFRLMLYDRKTGEKRDLSEHADYWVGTFIWSPDSSRIYYVSDHQEGRNEGQINVVFSTTVEPMTVKPKPWPKNLPENLRKGLHPITRINQWVQAWARGYADDLAFSPDGKTLFFTRMSLKRPNEIWKLVLPPSTNWDDLPRGEPLTKLNDAVLSQIGMSPLETFWFKGANDDEVEGFLVKPPNFDASKKYPVKFLIHGGPQGAWGDDWSYRWNPELLAANGYVVIMINFHGSTGYGQKFIDAINGDWGGAPYEDLMKGLDYAEQTYPFIDKNRECALGASYGGYMANWILGHTDRFKCIVSHDGMFNAESAWGSTEELWFNDWEFKGTPYDNRAMYEKWSPHQYAKNFKTPTLVIHGQRDYRLDVSEGFQLFTTLQMEGVPSKMLYFPDEGHWVLKPQNSRLWYQTVNDWVDQWTKK
jgi:dipeptidyl aminopeptidase/acylaminoacyl peptidase